MSIARYARKERLRFGAQKEIARALDVPEAYVSRVMNDKAQHLPAEKVRAIQVAIARRLGMRVDEAFPRDLQSSAA